MCFKATNDPLVPRVHYNLCPDRLICLKIKLLKFNWQLNFTPLPLCYDNTDHSSAVLWAQYFSTVPFVSDVAFRPVRLKTMDNVPEGLNKVAYREKHDEKKI